MKNIVHGAILTSVAIAVILAVQPDPARAAQSYDNCTGFIDSVPTVISTQGTWCLRADLASALASGTLVDVATNNVTIDCNHFKLGGLAAGTTTNAVGIGASGRTAITVRNCNIRGFATGIFFQGEGGGHVIEDNRLEYNTATGINAQGEHSIVRNNHVKDTGGRPGSDAVGISTNAGTTHGNVVERVFPEGNDLDAVGILALGQSMVRDNMVRGVGAAPATRAFGIILSSNDSMARDNDILGIGTFTGYGIFCSSAASTARGNVIGNVDNGIALCALSSNYVNSN